MRPGNPWSVKGIQPTTRQAAKEAARRHGMTLGQWLNHVILDSSEDTAELNNQRHRVPLQPGQQQKIDTSKLAAASASKSQHLQDKIDDIAARLDAVFDRSSGQVDLDQWEVTQPRSSGWSDLAVRTVTGDEQSREAGQHQPASERHATRKAEVIDERLSALTDRLDSIVEAREVSKSHSDQGLMELEAALRKVIKHIENSDQQNSDFMKSIQARLSELSSRTATANNEAMQQLSVTVSEMGGHLSQLSQRVVQSEANAEEFLGLEQQVSALADHLDSSLSRRVDPQIRALEERTNQISAQLDDLLQMSNGTKEDEQYELRFNKISEQLKTTEQQYMQLSSLEDSVNQLFDAVEQDRNAARENTLNTSQKAIATMETMVDQAAQKAAENAARRSAEHVAAIMADDGLNKKEVSTSIDDLRNEMRKLQETTITAARASAEEAISVGLGDQSTNDVAEPVLALRQKFDQFQDSSRSAELQNQDTLEAVHDTLEKVVERLVTLETPSLQSDNSAAPTTLDNPEIGVEDNSEPETEPDTNPYETPSPLQQGQRIDPIFGEPIADDSTTEKAGADRTGPALNQNYLEAARRAAQAASLSPKNMASDGEEKKAHEGDGSQPKNSILAMATEGNKKRKTLLLATAAVLLVIGALSAAKLIGDRSPNIVKSSARAPTATVPRDKLSNNAPDKNRQTSEGTTTKSPTAAKPAIPPVSQNTSPPSAGALKMTDSLLAQSKSVSTSNINSPTPPTIVTSAATLNELTGAKQKKQPRSSVKVARLNATASAAPAVLNDAMTARPVEPLPPEAIGPMALRRAAALGNATAQFEIANRYTTGKLVAQNFGKAISWYQKAAAQGLAPAQYILGTFYEKGRGVAKDKTAARIWYERAAMKGNLKAIHNLAVIYADGGNGKPDFAKAGLWFGKAAELGLADSQFNLAILHDRGLGVAKDSSKAYFWFQIAANQGDGDARARAEIIEKRLSADEIAQTRLLINNWRPVTLSQKANEVVLPADGWQRRLETAQVISDTAFNQKRLVILAQGYLTRLGFNPGPADGVVGTQTRQAIENFQQQYQLPVSGKINPTLVSKLKAATG